MIHQLSEFRLLAGTGLHKFFDYKVYSPIIAYEANVNRGSNYLVMNDLYFSRRGGSKHSKGFKNWKREQRRAEKRNMPEKQQTSGVVKLPPRK